MIVKELHKRIITGLVLLPLVVFVILFSQKLFILLLLLIVFFSSYEWFNLNKNIFSISSISGFLVIIISIFSCYFLRGNDQENIGIFLWIVFVCFFSDVGGFILGKTIGGKKITKISPSKTYAGAFGSFTFSTLPILIINFFNYELLGNNILILSWKNIFLSLLFSLICQIGDVTVSYFKRKKGVKDTGNLLPGHGGLLDRIDGLIFVMIFSGILKVYEVI